MNCVLPDAPLICSPSCVGPVACLHPTKSPLRLLRFSSTNDLRTCCSPAPSACGAKYRTNCRCRVHVAAMAAKDMAPSQLSILSFAVMPLTVLVLVAWARRDVVGLDWVPAALEPGCRVHACLNLTRRSPSWCLRWPQRKQRSSLPSCSAACF